jgi:hypothetical protein
MRGSRSPLATLRRTDSAAQGNRLGFTPISR